MNKAWLPVISLLVVACGDKDDDTATTDEISIILALDGDATSGATVFSSSCSACHGSDGTGGSAPVDLTTHAATMSDEAIVDTVLNGVGGMPAISIDDQSIADVLAYIRSEFG